MGRDWGLHYRVGGAKYNRADCSVMGPWPWFNTFWSKVEAEWSICCRAEGCDFREDIYIYVNKYIYLHMYYIQIYMYVCIYIYTTCIYI